MDGVSAPRSSRPNEFVSATVPVLRTTKSAEVPMYSKQAQAVRDGADLVLAAAAARNERVPLR